MRSYMFIVFSIIFLLFIFPVTNSMGKSSTAMEQPLLKRTCASKKFAKHSCKKRCLKHQKYPGQQDAANVVIDCSQHYFAVVPLQEQLQFFSQPVPRVVKLVTARKHLSPALKDEPDPPKYF
jgi:hypothetical protein